MYGILETRTLARRCPWTLALAYFVTAATTVWLTRFSGGVAFVWIASAILTSYLSLRPHSDWRPALIACGVASAVATSLFGLGPIGAPFLAMINLAEAVIAAMLLRRWVDHPGAFQSISEVAFFVLAASFIAPLVTAPFGSAVAGLVSGQPLLTNALSWYAGHALGALTFAPLALLIMRGEIVQWWGDADRHKVCEALALAIVMTATTAVVFVQTTLPLLFLPLLPALIATFRLGRLGAAASSFILIAVGVPCSLAGWGPVALIDGALGFRSQFFQFYVAIVLLTVLPAAAELQHRKRLFGALRDSELRYRLLAENTTDVIIWSELDTTRRYVSPAAKALLGYSSEELVGTKPLDFVHPDDRDAYAEILRGLTERKVEHVVTRQRYRRKDGAWIWVDVSFSLTFDGSSGAANGYVASLRDVTEHCEAEEALRLSEERLSLALDSGGDGLWDWDLASGRVELSEHWFEMLGFAPGEIEPHIRNWAKLAHPDDVDRSQRLLEDHLKGLTRTYECEYRLRKKGGGYVWTLARGKVVSRSPSGRAVRVVGTHMDVTSRKNAELQIEHMAHHDAMTGLPNRARFTERLSQIAAKAGRSGRQFALLACDLDRFKIINDTRGHDAGDTVLCVVAKRLRSILGDNDVVARLGGDEFAIIVERIDQPAEAECLAQRVIDAIGRPIDVQGQAMWVGVSVGIAIGQGDPAKQILKNADIALFDAKAAGGNVHRQYEHRMGDAIVARNMLELDLRVALSTNSFALEFQPIMDLATGRTCGFEALVRWRHPIRGIIGPMEFIPLAEDCGLIVQLGEWVLREACRAATRWPRSLRIAVNVSAVQFQHTGLETAVAQALRSSGLHADRLELEITESVLMRDAEGVVSSLMRLRALGVRIALDDFGTGYSSLSYLRRFPFNKIKIDRSFVVEIADPEVAAIVQAIVGLGKRNGAAVTAEGVETKEQLQLVQQEGCTEAQGFLFSRSLSVDGAERFLAERGEICQSSCEFADEAVGYQRLIH